MDFSWETCCPNPYWILQPEVVRLYLPDAGTLGCGIWAGAGIACSRGIPPDFYPPHVKVGPPILPLLMPLCAALHLLGPGCLSPPILSVWMSVALNPGCQTSIQFDFLAVPVFCFEVSCDSSCGCARRCSMSTYTSILTGRERFNFICQYFLFVFH